MLFSTAQRQHVAVRRVHFSIVYRRRFKVVLLGFVNVKIASNRVRSGNNDQMSSWSFVRITSMAFPTNTAILEH